MIWFVKLGQLTMATQAGSALASPCKRCGKNVVKNCLKCESCKGVYHLSCAKLSNNVKFLSDCDIICCDNKCDSNDEFFDALEKTTDNKVDVSVFKYILKQKDIIIQELYDKVNILNNHIELLNKFNARSSSENIVDKQKIDKPINVKTDIEVKSVIDKKDKNSAETKNVSGGNRNNLPAIKTITNKQVSAGLLQTETQLKMNEYINLTNEQSHPSTSADTDSLSRKKYKERNDKWTEVAGRKNRRRSVIVGNSLENAANVKGVPKIVNLHVCRVDPATTAQDLTKLLTDNFPEVSCEAMTSRFPSLYASFKVKIYESNFKKAMDPKLWPYGACIQRFLDHRKRNTTTN